MSAQDNALAVTFKLRHYHRFGFETLPYDSGRSMIVRITDLINNGFPQQ
jgi:hypothetical protein